MIKHIAIGKMVLIRFNKGYGVYTKGDTAGFEEATARKLVGFGVAVFADGTTNDDTPTGGVVANLPEQNKITNLCAICGQEFKTEATLKTHKTKKHGI